jgi:hypothetical protein
MTNAEYIQQELIAITDSLNSEDLVGKITTEITLEFQGRFNQYTQTLKLDNELKCLLLAENLSADFMTCRIYSDLQQGDEFITSLFSQLSKDDLKLSLENNRSNFKTSKILYALRDLFHPLLFLLHDSKKTSEKVANLIKANNNVSLGELVSACEYSSKIKNLAKHKSIAEIYEFLKAEYLEAKCLENFSIDELKINELD